MTHDAGRRALLGRSAAALATAGVAALASGRGEAAALAVPSSNLAMGRPLPESEYGMPSKFEAHVKRRRTDVLVNRQNYSDWSMTPLHQQHGTVTPNGLIYERHHNGVPDIDPDEHRFAIHGLVKQPLIFTMSDLMKYPSVSRFYFMECSGNGLTDWLKAASKTVQQTHGMLSCAQWTGVPVSTLLQEAGVLPSATWALAEGADGSAHARSIPMQKMLDDAMIVYAANGEMLRPENGYPLRLFIPGWEGNVSIKWLRRIKLGDQPWNLRSETARYTDPMPDGKWRQFSFAMEAKSVVTSPSGGMSVRPGEVEILGFAWSGQGKIRAVDVTLDGGRTWREAALEEPVLDKCLTRFRLRWKWDGTPTSIASRAVDSTGYVQPSVEEIRKVRAITGFVQHHNGVFPWSIDAAGEVKNAIA
ncbi:sulfite dehydrogenase [Methylibium sp.]|uniref:sulfite dehydrogenase n=1 Tax=Methylibium sp. TaxID=2067992 RepID=UPI003D1275E0